MWSVGCVVAEMLTLFPLLPGDSEIDQLSRVCHLLGKPTAERYVGSLAYTFCLWLGVWMMWLYDTEQRVRRGYPTGAYVFIFVL